MKRAVRLYVLVTQFIFTMILGGILGLIIARNVSNDKAAESIGAGIGLIVAFFISILLIIQFLKNERLVGKDD